MKNTSIVVAAWLITSNSVSIEGRLLRGKGKKVKGKKVKGKGGGKKNIMPWMKQSIVEEGSSSSEEAVTTTTTAATTTTNNDMDISR